MWKSKEESELRKKERVEKNKRMKRLTEKEIICTALYNEKGYLSLYMWYFEVLEFIRNEILT